MDGEVFPEVRFARETHALLSGPREHPTADPLSVGAVAAAEPLLLDITVDAVLNEEVLGDASGDDQLMILAAVYGRAARLLEYGDDREPASRLSIPLLTPGELLRWAALTVASDVDEYAPEVSRALEDRRQELERQLTWRTRGRAEARTVELLWRVTPDWHGQAVLEDLLHAICSRLERGQTVPDGAVVEILRAVVTAMEAGEGVGAPGGPPGGTLGPEEKESDTGRNVHADSERAS